MYPHYCVAVLCRPYLDFWSAKQAAAGALAEVINKLGGSINSTSVPAVARPMLIGSCLPGVQLTAASQWLYAASYQQGAASLMNDNLHTAIVNEHAATEGGHKYSEAHILMIAFIK